MPPLRGKRPARPFRATGRLARRYRSSLALPLAHLAAPYHPERVQDELVSNAELIGVQHCFVGVRDDVAASDAPGFVANYTCAMFAGRIGAICIAVIPGRKIGCRHFPLPTSLGASRYSWRVRVTMHKVSAKIHRGHRTGDIEPLRLLCSPQKGSGLDTPYSGAGY